MAEEIAPNQRNKPGYEGYLNDRVVTVASLLRDAGYRTFMAGKWHLGLTEDTSPHARGFDRSFAILTSASHFSDMRPTYSPDPDAKADYRQDGRMLSTLPETFEYSSQFLVDQMINYIDDVDSTEAPFFGYLAFSAPHWPLQAPDRSIEKFRGAYSEGYDVIFERRFAKQKSLGVIPADTLPAMRSPKGSPWADLSSEEQRAEERRMEVYAAMISEMDSHSGRLIEYLRDSGRLDNTVIIFVSDNGAEGHDLDDTWNPELYPAIRAVIDERHDHSVENMGRRDSYTMYGPNWARVSAPAFRMYKAFPTEGGTHTVAFAHYPKVFDSAAFVDEFITARDITPTILDLAGIDHPGSVYNGRAIEPMSGLSMVEALRNNEQVGDARVYVDELFGKILVRRGDWKLLKMAPPYGSGEWELYDLATDLSEQLNLVDSYPNIEKELIAEWDRYVTDNDVVLPSEVSGY